MFDFNVTAVSFIKSGLEHLNFLVVFTHLVHANCFSLFASIYKSLPQPCV